MPACLNVAAVIVTYNPDPDRVVATASVLAGQVGHIVVVDNGSRNEKELRQALAGLASCTLLSNRQNLGIAAALNQGMVESRARGFEWVLTLDQDSEIVPEYVGQMLVGATGKVGMLSPQVVDRRGEEVDEVPRPLFHGTIAVNQAITSGAITRVEAWVRVGGYDESMFIDLVDFEFCSRLRRSGFLICEVQGVAILHELGEMSTHRLLGRVVRVTNHNPFRVRQYARNTVYVMLAIEREWWPDGIPANLVRRVFKVVAFEDGKMVKMLAVARGVFAGVAAGAAHRIKAGQVRGSGDQA